jgi:ATP-dependent Lon protease
MSLLNRAPTLPVVSLKNATLFPDTVLPIRVTRAQSMRAIEQALRANSTVLALSENTVSSEEAGTLIHRLSKIGTLAQIERVTGDADEGYQVLLRGVSRVTVEQVRDKGDTLFADGFHLVDLDDLDSPTHSTLLITLKETTRAVLDLLPGNTDEIARRIDAINDLSLLVQFCLAHMDLDFEQ